MQLLRLTYSSLFSSWQRRGFFFVGYDYFRVTPPKIFSSLFLQSSYSTFTVVGLYYYWGHICGCTLLIPFFFLFPPSCSPLFPTFPFSFFVFLLLVVAPAPVSIFSVDSRVGCAYFIYCRVHFFHPVFFNWTDWYCYLVSLLAVFPGVSCFSSGAFHFSYQFSLRDLKPCRAYQSSKCNL